MELKICHLYPDVLNLSGDGGNVSCLKKRLEWRGMEATVTKLPIGEMRSLRGFDLVFIGGGQELGQEALLNDLHRGRALDIRAALEDGMVFLAVCGGFELLGQYHEGTDGKRSEFAGAVDMYTKAAKTRFTGDYMFECAASAGGSRVVAFENHGGRTFLGQGIEPLGRVLAGHGNNGDGTEGVHYKNLFGSYGHGPLLPKNPEFADFILKTALERKYGRAELAPLDDSFELKAHEEMCKRLGGGK